MPSAMREGLARRWIMPSRKTSSIFRYPMPERDPKEKPAAAVATALALPGCANVWKALAGHSASNTGRAAEAGFR